MTEEQKKQLRMVLEDVRQRVLDEHYADDMYRRQHASIALELYVRALLANEPFTDFIEQREQGAS